MAVNAPFVTGSSIFPSSEMSIVKSHSKDLKIHNTIAYTVTHTVAHPLRLPVPACEHLHKFAVDI